MDYIKELDIRLDKEFYYAGEVIAGKVILDTSENFKLKCKYFFRFPDSENLLVLSEVFLRILL